MTTGPVAETHIHKFQGLLRELFQFDCSDLDFGIYRIMNHKRAAVEKFISEKLPASISEELDEGSALRQAQASDRLAKATQSVKKALGDNAIGEGGELDSAYRSLPIGQNYLEARTAALGARSRDAIEVSIYNHLYTFFSRYYEDGDFISKRRYSRNQRYAIPYNGEEVYLHWANSDQYYVKTSENFYNYDWNAPNDVAVRFRISAADIEQNNVKGDKRFFLPRAGETRWDAVARAVAIPFEYRPLTTSEKSAYGRSKQQDKIIAAALEDIPKRLSDAPDALTALTRERSRGPKGDVVTHLEYHLRQYTRKNDSDFFIHKDLSGFLSRELDFYVKNEVLNLDTLEAAGEFMSDGWFQQMRLIKSVGGQIIEFLAQIEDFQKALWEKRKFVTETHYCITLANIDPELYPDIASNQAQWDEWQELFDVDGADRGDEFLKANPTLVLDTKHFSRDFNDRLLASFDDLDGMTDGLLIHSENWQALNLLQEKYNNRIKCIYIDPPYNTNASPILYKNGYKDSTWLSLIVNSLREAQSLLPKHGIFCCAIDDEEISNLLTLLESMFGTNNRLGVLCIESKPSGRTNDMFLATSHEYYLFFARQASLATINFFPLSDDDKTKYNNIDEISSFKWRDFLRTGGYSTPQERPNSFYPIYINPKTMELSLRKMSDWIEVLPIDSSGRHRVWRKVQSSFLVHLSKGEVRAKEKRGGGYGVEIIDRIKEGVRPKSIWVDAKYDAASHGTKLLKDIFGISGMFAFPKSIHAVHDAIFSVTDTDTYDIVLDYFAGSGTTGHAVINLNREDGGQRKFILVEMGDYFDTVLIPRIKKVTYAPEWRNGKPKRAATDGEAERSPRILKYIRMESYEDALDGIEFDDDIGQMNLEDSIEDYLLRYMLKWETQNSNTLLNVENLSSPFDYRLRAHVNGSDRERTADVAETFNYLLGLNVRTRRVHQDGERRYLVYRGETRESPGREVAVIWRDTKGWTDDDHERDRRFVVEHGIAGDADTVYVNSPSCIAGAKPLEPIFHDRMFARVNA